MNTTGKRIAIIGGGPSALFMYKRLVEAEDNTITIDIFERSSKLGAGMPYSEHGAGDEHVTNVSDNEIPEIVSSVEDWIQTAPEELLKHHKISTTNFNEYKVFPRLFFGNYLKGQFDLLLKKSKAKSQATNVHINSQVTDIKDKPADEEVEVTTGDGGLYIFDHVIICTGHQWPVTHEGTVSNYFDSPYPPAKLALQINYPVAIRGSSLTAIDAIRTLSRHNGHFTEMENGMLSYELKEECKGFKLVLHSRHGMLPAIRFHLEDSHLSKDSVLGYEDIQKNMQENEGFLSLDYVFEENFKKPIRENDPDMYERIKDLSLELFVEEMMALREKLDAFTLFKAEYAEAEKSIKNKQTVYWKEMLAVLSFTMNYPAKHFSAEDMLRLQKVLMPLISIVIAFVPQSSGKELIALYNAGVLDMETIGEDSYVMPAHEGGAVIHFTDEQNIKRAKYYRLFVDSIGQPHLHYDQFPFKSLLNDKVISSASLKFRSKREGEAALSMKQEGVKKGTNGDHYLQVPGITINDHFQVVDSYGALNPRIYIMAVPYISGYNPDYSGLDFCEAASAKIIKQLLRNDN